MSSPSILSYLYVPGSAPERFAKAEAAGAGAVILDLEDAVGDADKVAARAHVAAHLRSRADQAGPTPQAWVRINSGDRGRADLEALVGPDLAGVVLPKADSADELGELDARLTRLEADLGLPRGRIAVSPLIESGRGLVEVAAIAAAPRVTFLQLGEVDLAADLGLEPSLDERELLYARSRVVVASSAAGIARPVAPVSTEFRDLGWFTASTQALRRLGFFGRACIHPAQLAAVAEVFAPTAKELGAARDVLHRLDAAGGGAAVDAAGRMIDEAVARQARRILAVGTVAAPTAHEAVPTSTKGEHHGTGHL
ncbi:HpcH/HpaI aldolase/citrate lyase family protein [Nocardioides sp. Iso805N]|uniref:HpcH/HpaI aldolase/citrate lyase family protein n=1 Tax=Nocardioides sp. Iso805N TaxID=1283287 RepID=UPI00036DAA41|nr:CoA ester lyase [Nocardioides sp. Iso805N]